MVSAKEARNSYDQYLKTKKYENWRKQNDPTYPWEILNDLISEAMKDSCSLEYSTKKYPAFHEHRKEVKRILEEEYGFKVEYHRVKENDGWYGYQYNVFNISW